MTEETEGFLQRKGDNEKGGAKTDIFTLFNTEIRAKHT